MASSSKPSNQAAIASAVMYLKYNHVDPIVMIRCIIRLLAEMSST